ncbi:AAA family ATPase [Bradyrhizobium sp. CCBAU 11434]|uniref:AAA family ATPase n=1 Tax=Bradyrhizobium sp. CCBAU 11434 TaxID=1630885 RepID=UPI002304DD2C|nr:AAA family ATPase [Bradyrhizobium sp. CCBAU 11434]
MLVSTASNIVALPNRDDARRVQNKHNAMLLARNGIPVFPSSGKIPLVKLYNRRDTKISPEEREAAIEQAREEGNKQLTIFVGATTDPDIVKRMWRAPNWDAVPSIACGPASLVVIDADTKFNGPELIAALFEANGGVPEGVQVITTQSGGRHYIFSDPDNAFTNSAGALKKLYGCDVRGRGGQFVAPGSVREDGKRYGDQAALRAFIEAYTSRTIPPLPDYIVELIGAPSSELNEDIAPSKEREVVKQLDGADVPDWEELCTPLGEYDFSKLQDENTEFHSLYSNPSADCSDNRFKAARHVMREWPEMPVEHLASFFSGWDGAGALVDAKPRSGEYDNRQTAREWLKNQGLSRSSIGEAFGAVVDEDESREGVQSDSKAGHWHENAINIPVDLDINKLPPRPYLYAKYLMRGHVTLLSAAGGIGKSAWTLDSAIDIACGVDHLAAGEFKPRKVLVYNGEDDQDEMLRRVGAQFAHHNFTPEMRSMVRENLTIISGVKAPMRLAEYKDGRVALKEKAFEKLAEIIEGRGIDIVILDPLVALHSIPENANSEMNVIMTRFKSLAATKLIALLLAHHDKKNIGSKSVDDASQDDSRGAGTITTPVRVVLNMRRLSKKDAQTWRIPPEDVPHVIALSAGAKSNYSARDVTPRLYRAHSVQADNGTAEFAADSTVALAVYTPPRRGGGSGGIGDEATLKVLAALDGSEPVGSDTRHANWIGRLIADAAGWDLDAKHVRESVRDIIADWTARDWIAEAILEASGKGAERRKSVKVYRRGASRPAPREYAFDPVEEEDD